MTTRRSRILVIGTVFAALFVASCGDDAADERAGTEPPSSASATTTAPAQAATTAATDAAATEAPTTSAPALTTARDATAEIADLLGSPGPVVERPDDLAQAVADALVASGSDCEAGPPTATVVSVTPGEPAVAVIVLMAGCDDSVGGARYELTMEGDDTSGWGVAAATRQDICLRGASADLCV